MYFNSLTYKKTQRKFPNLYIKNTKKRRNFTSKVLYSFEVENRKKKSVLPQFIKYILF